MIEENIILLKQMDKHQDSIMKNISIKIKDEQERMEELEV